MSRGVTAGFLTSRENVLNALYMMGATCCAYSASGEWADRCDCKYGVTEGKWPTAHEAGTGCPELRSLYNVIAAMADSEWSLLVRRAGGIPSGLFAATPEQMEKRLYAADAAARMAAHNISEVRALLTLEAGLDAKAIDEEEE